MECIRNSLDQLLFGPAEIKVILFLAVKSFSRVSADGHQGGIRVSAGHSGYQRRIQRHFSDRGTG